MVLHALSLVISINLNYECHCLPLKTIDAEVLLRASRMMSDCLYILLHNIVATRVVIVKYWTYSLEYIMQCLVQLCNGNQSVYSVD